MIKAKRVDAGVGYLDTDLSVVDIGENYIFRDCVDSKSDYTTRLNWL